MAWFLAFYALVLLVVAYVSMRYNDTLDRFLVAGRNQPRILIIASMLASTIGGGITIGTVSRAYSIGFPAFWFVASGALAHFLQARLISGRVRRTEAVTLPGLAGTLAGDGVRRLTAVIILFTWTGIAAGQFLAASKIVSTMTGLGSVESILLSAAFLVLYTLMGGQKSVLRTDFVQFGILAVSLLASLAWLYLARPPASGIVGLELFNPKFSPLDLVYYLVVVAGSYFICPMMFGRILSADSPKSARFSSYVSGSGMLLFAFAITFIGMWAKNSGFDPGTQDPFNAIMRNVLPGWLGVFMLFGVLAAILSTADTVLLTAAGVLEHDIVEGTSLSRTRIWVAIISAVACSIALFESDIIALLLKTYQGYTSGLVPALFIVIMTYETRVVRPAFIFAAIAGGYALGFAGNFLASPDAQKLMAFAGLAFSALVSLAGVRSRRTEG